MLKNYGFIAYTPRAIGTMRLWFVALLFVVFLFPTRLYKKRTLIIQCFCFGYFNEMRIIRYVVMRL